MNRINIIFLHLLAWLLAAVAFALVSPFILLQYLIAFVIMIGEYAITLIGKLRNSVGKYFFYPVYRALVEAAQSLEDTND